MTKTPRFSAALENYFSGLVLDTHGGQWRTCRFSQKPFYVRPEDIEFYKSMGVPLPTLSPHERGRRRFAFSNSYNLYRRPSSLSGNMLISQYLPETPFPVYEQKAWHEDGWDPFSYGRDVDPSAPFFSQLKELMDQVPRPNLNQEGTMVGSDYCHNVTNLKNCYLVFASNDSEECMFSVIANCKNSLDVFAGVNCDTCYDSFEIYDSWKCFYSQFVRNCQESYFLYDSRGCTNCFGGVNLRNRKYVFFNEQLTEAEYKEQMAKINMGDSKVVAQMKARFEELKKTAIHKPVHSERAVNSTGHFLNGSVDCHMCFYPLMSERLAYSIGGTKSRDSYDLVGGVGNERCYDSFPGFNNYEAKFSFEIDGSRSVEYSQMCSNSHDLFGCVGLKNKSFCIFNVQYSEEEYWKKVDEIKTAMLERGEYGEFFSPELSPFPYRISEAMSWLGYDDISVAGEYGYRMDDVPKSEDVATSSDISRESVASDIAEVGDDILEKTLVDKNGKRFRVVPNELAFYRANRIPIPEVHYSTRIEEKRKRMGAITFSLHDRTCMKCGAAISSAYAPGDARIVYCEACYQGAVA